MIQHVNVKSSLFQISHIALLAMFPSIIFQHGNILSLSIFLENSLAIVRDIILVGLVIRIGRIKRLFSFDLFNLIDSISFFRFSRHERETETDIF